MANQNRPITEFYRIGELYRKKVKRFGTEGAQYRVDFQHLNEVKNFFTFIPEVFDSILKRIMGVGHEKDMIGLEINHPALIHGPILIPFRKRKDLDVENILQAFESVSTSKRGLTLDETMYVRITTVDYTFAEPYLKELGRDF